MKKLLMVLAIGTFAACGNGTDDTTADDSTMMDTVAPMMSDTTMRDTSTMMGDTSTMMVDTTVINSNFLGCLHRSLLAD